MKSGGLRYPNPISSPPSWCPWDLFRSFKVCSGAKEREWGAKSDEKLPHLYIPGKTAALVPEFAVEDLPLGRTTVLVPEFAVKDLLLGRRLMIHDDDDDRIWKLVVIKLLINLFIISIGNQIPPLWHKYFHPTAPGAVAGCVSFLI